MMLMLSTVETSGLACAACESLIGWKPTANNQIEVEVHSESDQSDKVNELELTDSDGEVIISDA